ncbi:PKD domain-containing protein [Caenimonas koreensis DSM 17982]|uniref:PKD domain-containing protein n=1 Tax=Caenimonas koreensis DSM 17982 TaxID=1121255 RepID=A0A844AQN3_9BURK|nr:PKD domain-containing protein [Caenimonas koreensis]MRD46590.1 PKD domain-containing protein [Caenimonas koreensis DSM 17982]
MISNLNLAGLRAGAALIGLLASLGMPLQAHAQAKDGGNATDAINPYSPRYGHPYRHGVVPTREVHSLMKAWADRNVGVDPAAAAQKIPPGTPAVGVNSKTLSFNGGVNGVGVTSGTPKVYLVFWGSQWGTQGTDSNGYMTLTGDPMGAAPYMQKWIKGLGTNSEGWSGVMTQYCDGPLVAKGATTCPAGAPRVGYPGPGTLAGVWYDNAAPAPRAANDHEIGAEAVRAAAFFGNTTAASNRYVQYIIMSPTGTTPDGFNTPNGGFCAWHDFTGDTALTGGAVPSPYGDIAFTNMPYVTDAGESCGANFVSNVLDGFSLVGGHEYAETITDQFPDGGWINLTGITYRGEENADECSWISSGQGASAMVTFATGSFAMQSTWSNDTNRCDITHPTVTGSGGTPTANFTFKTTGLTAAFTDTSTDSGGTIGAHAWTFGDGGTSSATNPSHTYAAAGSYSVTEKVTDSANGKTSSKTSTVTVSAGGGVPSANFTVTTSGLTANFTDTSTDSGGTIGSRAWTFGDGTTSTKANPSHTYASAGTYSVSETVKDSVNGSISTKTATVTVPAGSPSQLVLNPGFEAGASSWTVTAGVVCTNSTCPGETARAGTGFIWLGGNGRTLIESATQTIAIPAGKTSATLSFYLHIDSKESGTVVHDTLKVQVLNASGAVQALLATYSNVDAASGYSLVSINMNAYIGRTISLRFLGKEDASLATSFVIDDVALTVQ